VQILDFTGGHQPVIPEADLYGMTLLTTSYPDALVLRDSIRSISNSPIVVGGPHAMALPDLTAKDFDYVAVGEAEADITDYVERMVLRELDSRILYLTTPSDLGALLINDYSLIDVHSYSRILEGKRAFSILSGRGCPFRCIYCYTAARAEKLRLRPVEHVMAELEHLDLLYGVGAIQFVDDNFLMNLDFLRALAPRLREFGRPYRAYCRATDLTEERCQLLAKSGCRMVACGVESGSQTMHNLMHTDKSVAKMTLGIRTAKHFGLHVRVGLIVGFPGETWDTVKESICGLLKMPFDTYNLFNFIPFPGTDPFHNPSRYGISWLSNNWKDYYVLYGNNSASYAFEHKNLNRQELAKMRAYMIAELNRVSRPAYIDNDFK
jgi:radical SAM superfamily enzyme YgiQ (UPF0313 family)